MNLKHAILCRTCSGSEGFCCRRSSDISDPARAFAAIGTDKSLTTKPSLDTGVSTGSAQFYVTDDNKAVQRRNRTLAWILSSYWIWKLRMLFTMTLYEQICPNSNQSAEEHGQDWVSVMARTRRRVKLPVCLWKLINN